jgi:hypothetical protein
VRARGLLLLVLIAGVAHADDERAKWNDMTRQLVALFPRDPCGDYCNELYFGCARPCGAALLCSLDCESEQSDCTASCRRYDADTVRTQMEERRRVLAPRALKAAPTSTPPTSTSAALCALACKRDELGCEIACKKGATCIQRCQRDGRQCDSRCKP